MLDTLMLAVNLRDIGGVRTADGQMVRQGLVYRSAALTGLDAAGLVAARALGIRSIVDLRRNAERSDYPTPWQALGCTDYWGRDHEHSEADQLVRLRAAPFTADAARAAMVTVYAALPWAQAEAYARLFRLIAAGEGPVLFHCAAGKDRTGVAAALILAAVGVPRAAILDDYVATARADLDGLPHRRAFRDMPAERKAAFAPVLAAEPGYLDAMFAALERRSGTIDAYLRDTLGLGAAEVEAVRQALIVPRR